VGQIECVGPRTDPQHDLLERTVRTQIVLIIGCDQD
jgi:hypothetical protein